mgnify:CR=1 FL=1
MDDNVLAVQDLTMNALRTAIAGALLLFAASCFFSIAVNSLALGLIAILWIALMIGERRWNVRPTPYDYFFLAYVIAELLSTAFSVNRPQSVLFSKRLLLIGVVYAIVTHCTQERDLRRFVAVLLGSATPDVETLYRFEQERWHVIRMANRILAHGDIPTAIPEYSELPQVEVVDMRQELTAGNRSAISRVLHNELAAVLQRNEQAILFLNRRGSASYVFCRKCGYVLHCPRCETQLTWHADESALICHTCNYRRQMPRTCPSCGKPDIRQFGLGTQSLETLVLSEFPAARVLRWDADTARFKGAHDIILDHFTQHRADILIGTQMLAKGLDLPLVTLVGVVLADVSLNLPDFRAAERTYQLLTQVAGRAGRSGRGGRVILQTFQPDHYAIRAAAAYDAAGFYQTELAWREHAAYPPYSRLLKIEFRHSDALTVQKAAMAAGEQLAGQIAENRYRNTSLIGPVPCFYQKRAGVYRWQLVISVGLMLTASIGATAGPYLMKVAIDRYITRHDPAGLQVVALGFLAVLIGSFVVEYLQTYVLQYVGQRIMFDMRMQIYRHLQKISVLIVFHWY